MLERARRRAAAAGVSGTTFVLGDVQNVQIGRRFDAVLSMFAVVGYQISDAAVRSTLGNVRSISSREASSSSTCGMARR